MKNLIFFVRNSFLWQWKSFFVVNLFAILSLIALTYFHELILTYGTLVLYVLLIYSLIKSGDSVGSIGTNQGQAGPSFSGKYLLSLPISKKKLLINLLVSNFFCLIPLIYTFLYWSFLVKNYSPILNWEKFPIILFIIHHPLIILISIFLLYLTSFFILTRHGVELPRKAFTKGTYLNRLISAKGIISYLIYLINLFWILFLAQVVNNESLVLFYLVYIVCLEMFKTYKSLVNESVSYWIWKVIPTIRAVE
jgi:hypothetical protein